MDVLIITVEFTVYLNTSDNTLILANFDNI